MTCRLLIVLLFPFAALAQSPKIPKAIRFHEWFVQLYDDSIVVLDLNGHPVITFEGASVQLDDTYKKSFYANIRNYNEDEEGGYLYHPVMRAERTAGKKRQFALYDLNNRRFMTDWSSKNLMIDNMVPIYNGELYILRDQKTKNVITYHPWQKAFEVIAARDYKLINHSGPEIFCVFIQPGNNSQLYRYSPDNGLKLLLSAPEIGSAEAMLEKYTSKKLKLKIASNSFALSEFVIFRDSAGLFGFINKNGEIYASGFEKIAPGTLSVEAVNVMKNAKWGAVYPYRQTMIEPQFDQPIETEDEDHLTKRSRDGYYLNPEDPIRKYNATDYPEIYEENSLFGLRIKTDFPDVHPVVNLIPPVYPQLITIDIEVIPGRYKELYIAKNNKGKFGILSFQNDTMAGFEYDTIVPETDLREGLRLYKGKGKERKTGFFNGGHIVPAIYDYVLNPYEFHGFLCGKNGKIVAYDYDGNFILQEGYDSIYCRNERNDWQMLAKRDGKWQVLNYVNINNFDEKRLLATKKYDFVDDHFGYVTAKNGYSCYTLSHGFFVEVVNERELNRRIAESKEIESGY